MMPPDTRSRRRSAARGWAGAPPRAALEQMCNLALKDTIGVQPDGIEEVLCFQHLV